MASTRVTVGKTVQATSGITTTGARRGGSGILDTVNYLGQGAAAQTSGFLTQEESSALRGTIDKLKRILAEAMTAPSPSADEQSELNELIYTFSKEVLTSALLQMHGQLDDMEHAAIDKILRSFCVFRDNRDKGNITGSNLTSSGEISLQRQGNGEQKAEEGSSEQSPAHGSSSTEVDISPVQVELPTATMSYTDLKESAEKGGWLLIF